MNRQGSDSAVQGFNDWEGGMCDEMDSPFFFVLDSKKRWMQKEKLEKKEGELYFSLYCIYIY